ncbi:MAG TPA: carboxypeptidase-like regulatory domain-containing protein, partial [Bryobacteraceae bacterium]|nr:carboxypeptidase-like regulatory domain-containing protein [Bryobacteraceae bacterium]
MGSICKSTALWLIAMVFAAGLCQAQEGSITGSVRDSSGAALPKAVVTVSSNQQSFSRSAVTNDSGDYLIPGLPAGSYNILVKAAGFQTYQVKDLILRVADKARADASLSPGQVNSEITVAGVGVSQVQTESSELSGTITNKQIDQLVL